MNTKNIFFERGASKPKREWIVGAGPVGHLLLRIRR
jgi:hypothetical protein